jgi:hypothetical protein
MLRPQDGRITEEWLESIAGACRAARPGPGAHMTGSGKDAVRRFIDELINRYDPT